MSVLDLPGGEASGFRNGHVSGSREQEEQFSTKNCDQWCSPLSACSCTWAVASAINSDMPNRWANDLRYLTSAYSVENIGVLRMCRKGR